MTSRLVVTVRSLRKGPAFGGRDQTEEDRGIGRKKKSCQ